MTTDIKREKEPVSVVSKILNILQNNAVDPDPYVFVPPGSRSCPSTRKKIIKTKIYTIL
jgi:hypothetical protein